MNDRLLSFLGLCKRAGYLISGADTVVRTVKDKKALLVLTANDFSDNSLKNVEKAAVQYGVPIRTLKHNKDALSFAPAQVTRRYRPNPRRLRCRYAIATMPAETPVLYAMPAAAARMG